MNPEDVNSKKFKVDKIVFNNDSFSIAYGIWEDGLTHLAMRWNGGDGEKGFPTTFGNPVWFLITPELKIPILQAIKDIDKTKNEVIIEALNKEFSRR